MKVSPMKIAERHFEDDGKLIILETHDPNPVLDTVAELKSHNMTGWGENKHVARIPNFLIEQWLQESGLSYSDDEAVKDMLKQKLLSGDFDNIRPWTGTF